MKYAGGDQVQNVSLLVESNGMAGVVSALVAGHAVEFPGQDVDNFTFAFIPPLETYNCEIHGEAVRRGACRAPW